MTALKKLTYPTINGKPMDSKRKRAFNAWRKHFYWTIGKATNHHDEALKNETLATAAWNCAFAVVTSENLP